MATMSVRFSRVEVSYSARGRPTYRIEIWHDGLKKHRQIKGSEKEVVERKAQLQAEEWESKWEAVKAKEAIQKHQANQKVLANEQTSEARATLEMLERTLEHTLSIDDAVDWEQLKDTNAFSELRPQKPRAPAFPKEPSRYERAFQPDIGFLDRIFPLWRQSKEARASDLYKKAHAGWLQATLRLKEQHDKALEIHAAKDESWRKRRTTFLEKQRESHATIDRQRERCEAREHDAIEEYCDLVLSRSTYPDWMPQEFEFSYLAESSTLLVSYSLPSVEAIPRLREVTYIQSRDEFAKKTLSDAQVRKLYDSLVYQITLRTVHELFEADRFGALDSVVFNGYVTSVDRRTGLESTACILSLQTTREEFLEINLSAVDPKACFKALKGVGSSKLHSLTPIAPIMEMRRDDGRFVSARELADTLDDSVNLATMDWEDFEHLIRELFEQEFRSSGGEVKVTQASRDGGVDAVAFDPDPIRGGKIVIQAKRYTNTVGVADVRDLYGTVLNEGATKGILVTTSDYGPAAYEFAKDKPLVLMGGSNLLHLLEKHGHQTKIDIKEAREQRDA